MNCKNCEQNITDTTNFCADCGAKVVLERITTKRLWRDFAAGFFGWDNKYLMTLKKLVFKPEQILKEYINGTRKKYVAPFVFLAIGTAIAMLVFTELSDKYIELSNSFNEQQYDFIQEQLGTKESFESYEEDKKEQIEGSARVQKSILRYFNIFTFLLLPIYALIAYWVFGKPHNYGEHLVINCYIQGVTFLIGVIFFLVSIFTSPVVYMLSFISFMVYYLYVYKRLNGYSFGTVILKLFKFLGIILIFSVLPFAMGLLVGLLGSKFG